VAVVDADLRHGAEKEAAHRGQPKQQRDNQGGEPRAHPPGDPALLRHDGEYAVGGGDQPPRKADSLHFVGIQQAVRGAVV
jgi:hypothetical protein